MKMTSTSHPRLAPILCLVLFTSGVRLSNPDSEMVQENVGGSVGREEDKVVQRSAAMRVADSLWRSSDYSETSYSTREVPRIKVFKPIVTSIGVLWKEVDAVYDAAKDGSVLYGIYKGLGDRKDNGGGSAGSYPGGRPPADRGLRVPERVPETRFVPYADRGEQPGGQGGRRLPADSMSPPNQGSGRGVASGTNYRDYGPQRPDTRIAGGGGNPRGDTRIAGGGSNPRGDTRIAGGNPRGDTRIAGGDNPRQDTRIAGGGNPRGDTRIAGGGGNPRGDTRIAGGGDIPRGDTRFAGDGVPREDTRIAGGNSRQDTTRGSPATGVSNGNRDRAAAPSPDLNLFAGIVNDFAFKLVETLNPQSNFVVSPLSLFLALGMCYLGSAGRTRDQLERTLGLNENSVHGDHLHKGIMDLMVSMVGDGIKDNQLSVANGLFLGANLTVDPRFGEEVQRFYAAELHNVDFADGDSSLSAINGWVSRSTRNAIPTLLESPPLPLTRMLLLNAVYFKGTWKTQFPPDLTFKGQFHSSDGKIKEVPTMSLYDETLPFHRSAEHRHSFIKLPYSYGHLSMVIAMPDSAGDRPMPRVSDRILCHVMDAMRDTRFKSLAIPKFRLEDTQSLKRAVVQLGAGDLFDRRFVDLRRMRCQNDVHVSAILQKALLEVDERGTTAAAVTGVRFVPLIIQNATDFVVDRPFAFYVIHEPSGLALFYGKVNDLGEVAPAAENGDGGDNNRGRVRPRPNSDSGAPGNTNNAPGNNDNAPGNTNNASGNTNNAPGNNNNAPVNYNNIPGNTNNAPGNNNNAPVHYNNIPGVNNNPGNNNNITSSRVRYESTK